MTTHSLGKHLAALAVFVMALMPYLTHGQETRPSMSAPEPPSTERSKKTLERLSTPTEEKLVIKEGGSTIKELTIKEAGQGYAVEMTAPDGTVSKSTKDKEAVKQTIADFVK